LLAFVLKCGNPKLSLPNQNYGLAFDQILLSHIVKARCVPNRHPDRAVDLAQDHLGPVSAQTRRV
jgi:hypothetical protein